MFNEQTNFKLVSLKNVVRLFTGLILFSTISFTQSVSVASPSDGATVSSPVHFVGSADGGGFPATAVRIYVDGQSMYTTNSANLDTSVSIPAGSHFVVVQAWNSAGQVFKSPMNITVANGAPPPGRAG